MTVIGVDVGGTFTDTVCFDGETLRSWKTPTTDPQTEGVAAAVSHFVSGTDFEFRHGTTVATNALLEGSGGRVVLVTDPGFEDVIEIARQSRPSLYDQWLDRPDPLVGRSHRIGHHDIDTTLAAIEAAQPDAVAVSLLGSYRDESAEGDLVEAIRRHFPEMPVSAGTELSPGFREYERVATTVLDAYLAPRVAGYLRSLSSAISPVRSFVMTSSGGLATFDEAASSVGRLTLSGPAGGVVAGDCLREAKGLDSVITFDMGGTSTDVARVGPEGVVHATMQRLGGRVNRVPSMPVHTVGAGGGSIAWCDPGGALRVGPESAGAHPGPAAYGRGGRHATVTDANVFLGLIPEQAGGGLVLDAGLAAEALRRLGRELGLGARETASGILEVVDAHMERAIRKVSVEEGFDLRHSSLIAFGGAGGLHSSRLARGLQMRSVIIPPHTGAFSALGLLLATPRVEELATALVEASSESVVELAASLARRATARFVDQHGTVPTDVELSVDVRYRSQAHELTVPFRAGSVVADFERDHQMRFGFVLEGGAVEVVNVRAVALGEPPITWQAVAAETGTGPTDRSTMWLGDREIAATVHSRRSLTPGAGITGPAVVVDDTATVLLLDGDGGVVHEDGSLEVTW